jgi:WD40 repeat protein
MNKIFVFFKVVIGGSNSGQIDFYYDSVLSNNDKLKTFKTFHTSDITFLKYLSMNNSVASCSYDTTVSVWNPNSGESILSYTQHKDEVLCLDQIDEDILVSGSRDKTIHVWKISTGETIIKINTSTWVYSVKSLSNGLIACGLFGSNNNLKIYDYLTGNSVQTLHGHTRDIYSVEILNEQFIASGSKDTSVIIWDLYSYSIKYNLTGHSNGVKCLKRLSSYLIASGDSTGEIFIWNWSNGTFVYRLIGHKWDINSLDLYDDQTLISGSRDRKIKFWNIRNAQLMRTINTNLQINALSVLKRGK